MAMIGLRKPRQQRLAVQPEVGELLPVAASLPRSASPFRVFVFLRHVGCPFAEKTVKDLRYLGESDPRVEVVFVSHGDEETTAKWLEAIGGPAGARWIDDPLRQHYGNSGLGYSRAAHFLGRASLSAALALRSEGIRNRSASGTRWQQAGAFLVSGDGRVVWKHVPESAEQLPTAEEIGAAMDRAEANASPSA